MLDNNYSTWNTVHGISKMNFKTQHIFGLTRFLTQFIRACSNYRCSFELNRYQTHICRVTDTYRWPTELDPLSDTHLQLLGLTVIKVRFKSHKENSLYMSFPIFTISIDLPNALTRRRMPPSHRRYTCHPRSQITYHNIITLPRPNRYWETSRAVHLRPLGSWESKPAYSPTLQIHLDPSA